MDPIVAVVYDASASRASAEVLAALAAVRTLGPALLLAILVTFIVSRKPSPIVESPSEVVEPDSSEITPVTVSVIKPRRVAILTILTICAISYLLDGTVIVVQAIINKTWEGSSPQWSGIEVADVIGLIAFGGLVIVGSWKDAKGFPVWQGGRIKFFAITALAFEIAHVILLCLSVTFKKHPISIPEKPPYPALIPYLHVACASLRVLLLLPLYPVITRPIVQYTPATTSVAETNGVASTSAAAPSGITETSSLLAPPPVYSNGDGQKKQYGTFLPPPSTAPSTINGTITPPPSNAGIFTKPVRQKTPTGPVTDASWSEMFQKVSKLTPYLWPKKSKKLQFVASLCVLILLVGRVVNFLLPFTLRELVDTFDKGTAAQRSPWMILLVYVLLRFLQGAGGLNALRDVLWAPVMQYSDREMSQLSFDHLLNLSLAFHTRKKTGEILRILDRGAAINHIFELLLFNIIPTILDIVVAIGAFFYFFGYVLSSVVLVVFALYVIATTQLTKWRTQLRRAMNERDIITRGIHTDSLLNYETVKYFGGEAHESARYADAIAQYQALEYKVIATLNLLNFVQNFIISTGLLVGSLIVSWRVVHAGQTAADFIFFVTYLAQLYGPLNTLGYIYRSINQNLIDTEKLINLLNEPTDVKDKPDATDLIVTDGAITFDHVSFSYDGRTTALKDVSFQVPKGHSVALVGESGSGKSTILRLLFRQYDLTSGQGAILIDGQDIRDVKQVGLRKAIGVVPQDSILFNSSISYNIGYGKFEAAQDEIETAAKAAQMHDRILSFPDGYETKVGERGVRLSGGEKQRISIARTFLKNAPILALDEATSALDTSTEKDIQNALQNLLAGRTSISIAHRLSTIAHADLILVLKDGEIIESGSHKELLALNGVFASMWSEQINERITESGGALQEATPDLVEGYELEVPADNRTTSDLPQVETPVPYTPADPDAQSEVPRSEVVDISESPVEPKHPVLADNSVADVPSPITEESDKPTFAEIASDKPAPSAAPVAFPSSDDTPVSFPSSGSGPVGFPKTEDDIASVDESKKDSTSAGITFKDQESVPTRPGDGTEKEKKRSRISSQNLQRLARRISIGRRPSSGPGSLKDAKDSDTPVLSREGSVSGTQTPRRQDSIDIPAGSSSASAVEERPGTPASGEEGTRSKMSSLLKPLRKPTRRGSLF